MAKEKPRGCHHLVHGRPRRRPFSCAIRGVVCVTKLDLWLAVCLVVLLVGTCLFMGTFVVALVVPPRALPPLQALRFVTACIALGAGILFLLSWLLFPLTDNWRFIRRFLAFGAGDDPAVDRPSTALRALCRHARRRRAGALSPEQTDDTQRRGMDLLLSGLRPCARGRARGRRGGQRRVQDLSCQLRLPARLLRIRTMRGHNAGRYLRAG
jgi:hypothetical protein